jgi:hypothetical protein
VEDQALVALELVRGGHYRREMDVETATAAEPQSRARHTNAGLEAVNPTLFLGASPTQHLTSMISFYLILSSRCTKAVELWSMSLIDVALRRTSHAARHWAL